MSPDSVLGGVGRWEFLLVRERLEALVSGGFIDSWLASGVAPEVTTLRRLRSQLCLPRLFTRSNRYPC